jgi:hypothetical protein
MQMADDTRRASSTPRYPLISLDLPDVEAALQIAKNLVELTGRAVTIRDDTGAPVATFQKPCEH